MGGEGVTLLPILKQNHPFGRCHLFGDKSSQLPRLTEGNTIFSLAESFAPRGKSERITAKKKLMSPNACGH